MAMANGYENEYSQKFYGIGNMEIWKYGNMEIKIWIAHILYDVKVKIYREYPGKKIRDPSHHEHADKIDSREKASTSLARN